MNDYLIQLLNKYRNRGLFLDTVLFVLLAVGSYDRKLIGTDKRLSGYVPEDFDTLLLFIQNFKSIITAPNVITEVSNLTKHLLGTEFSREFVRQINLMTEEYVPSKQISNSDLFFRVGITDAVIAQLSRGKFLVLTDDLPLVGQLQKLKIDVLNFNHIRVLNWT